MHKDIKWNCMMLEAPLMEDKMVALHWLPALKSPSGVMFLCTLLLLQSPKPSLRFILPWSTPTPSALITVDQTVPNVNVNDMFPPHICRVSAGASSPKRCNHSFPEMGCEWCIFLLVLWYLLLICSVLHGFALDWNGIQYCTHSQSVRLSGGRIYLMFFVFQCFWGISHNCGFFWNERLFLSGQYSDWPETGLTRILCVSTNGVNLMILGPISKSYSMYLGAPPPPTTEKGWDDFRCSYFMTVWFCYLNAELICEALKMVTIK